MTILLRFLRMALAAALVAAASGVPQVALAAIAADCCGDPCDSERDGQGCPPGCTSGPCAKVFPAAVPQERLRATVRVVGGATHAVALVAPVLPLVASAVFHPPRA